MWTRPPDSVVLLPLFLCWVLQRFHSLLFSSWTSIWSLALGWQFSIHTNFSLDLCSKWTLWIQNVTSLCFFPPIFTFCCYRLCLFVSRAKQPFSVMVFIILYSSYNGGAQYLVKHIFSFLAYAALFSILWSMRVSKVWVWTTCGQRPYLLNCISLYLLWHQSRQECALKKYTWMRSIVNSTVVWANGPSIRRDNHNHIWLQRHLLILLCLGPVPVTGVFYWHFRRHLICTLTAHVNKPESN